MKVYGKCKGCSQEVSSITETSTRVELAMRSGESKELNCKNCGKNAKYHVDELYAKPSKFAQSSAGFIFLIGTPLMFLFVNPVLSNYRNHYVIYAVGGFLMIPVFVYAVINIQDQSRVSAFNKRKLKGRIHNI